MTDWLTIGHANVHGNAQGARILRRAGCDSVGLNEVSRLALVTRGWRTVRAVGVRDRRATENAVQVRRARLSLGAITLQVSETVPGVGSAHLRWLAAPIYRHPEVGRVAHVSVHLNYAGRGNARPDVLREYDESTASLVRVCRLLEAEGCAVVVTGDVNMPPGLPSPDFLTAWEAFNELGYAHRAVGRLDAVAWSDRLELHAMHTLTRARLGSDHPGLVATFRRRST